MSRLIVKNLPNGVSKLTTYQRPRAVTFCVGSPKSVCLACR